MEREMKEGIKESVRECNKENKILNMDTFQKYWKRLKRETELKEQIEKQNNRK